MLGRRFNLAEVGDRQSLGAPALDDSDRVLPGLDVNVRRWSGGNDQVRVRDEDGGDVADEGGAAVLVQIANVVGGVARGVGNAHAQHPLTAAQRPHVGLGNREDLTPESLHLLAVEALGAGEQPAGVDQVGGSALVDVDLKPRPASHQSPGRRRVVEVDVGEQQGPRLLVCDRRQHGVDRGLRPGVDQRALDLPAADHVRASEMHDVDHAHRDVRLRRERGQGGARRH